jgi:hypothetical protein
MAATTEAGRVLAGGRYRVERLLGAGGMATVWLAHDERLDRPVAIKEMAPVLAEDERFVARFRREARIAAALSHPNLVRVFDFAVDDGRPFLVMEHVPGGTLAERLNGGQGVGDCIGVARALLEALDHIHRAGIVHRDLKPANILIGADERPKITDFGIAHSLGSGRLTSAGHVVGAARFVAPEVRAGGPSSAASDLYGLGVLLRECTRGTGSAPLERLVDTLVAEDPSKRPESAGAALRRLNGDTGEVPLHQLVRTAAARRRAAAPPAPPRPGATAPIAAADPGASLAAATALSASRGAKMSRCDAKSPRDRAARRPRADRPAYARGPRRVAVTLLLLVAAAAALAGLAATGGDPTPREAPAAVSGTPASHAPRSGGTEVDRSLDRIERIVRTARER